MSKSTRGVRVGDVIRLSWGNQLCIVRRVLAAGTVEVENPETGRWYRCSGLRIDPLGDRADVDHGDGTVSGAQTGRR